jgi:GT2 family glycosyltransferase
MRKATLIVLAWNRWPLTQRCLETLRATDLSDAEVLVVDNGSTDETRSCLAEFDWVRVVRLPRNLGFVRGNNAGIAAAAPDSDLVLLNNDLVFSQRDWLPRLRKCAAATEVGIVGCRLRLPDGHLLHAGTFILPDTIWGQQIGSLEKDLGQFASSREVEGIVFACAYLKREVVDAIGGLALDYESYFEDTDYCLRARAAGFRTVVCGEVTLVHDEHGSTSGQPEVFAQLFRASRESFGRKWKSALEARYRADVLWQSIMNFPTGYGRTCRALVRQVDELGVRATYRYVYGPGTPFQLTEPEDSRDYYLNVVRQRELSSEPKLSVVLGQGNVFDSGLGRYRVGFTMLEVDRFPPEWVAQANRTDEVWTPSEFNRQGMLASGVNRPVRVMPLGIDPDYFHPGMRGFPNPLGEFVFLTSFEWGERKDPWMLLRAFNDTFSADEPARLVCKISNRDPSVRLREEIGGLRLREAGGKISYLFNLEFPDHQLGSLYRSGDCFVAPSRGEGWNMPLMEAMACGLPAIATDWSAHQEYLHDGIAYPLRIRGTKPAVARCPYYAGANWAEPDEEHLRFLLRHVYENREEAARKGVAAAAEIAERWTWRRAAERIRNRLLEIQEVTEPEPRSYIST